MSLMHEMSREMSVEYSPRTKAEASAKLTSGQARERIHSFQLRSRVGSKKIAMEHDDQTPKIVGCKQSSYF